MSVCNIFKSLPGSESVFYTFSEYTNDLPLAKSTNDVQINPTGFICLDLDLDAAAIKDELQNYFENLCCCERDDSLDSTENDKRKYKNYLLGGLLKRLVSKEFISNYDNVMYKKIDIFSDGTYDGMNYDEIVCYLEPNDTNNFSISFSTTDVCEFKNINQYLKGYQGNDTYKTAYIGTENFPKATITNSTGTGESEVVFNTIIVLYELKIGNIVYANIPLGVYINNISEGSITKYTKSSTIYDQGTSYALRICMRYANTIDGSKIVSAAEVSLDNSDTQIVPLIESFNRSMIKMDNLVAKINEYSEKCNDVINAYISNYGNN